MPLDCCHSKWFLRKSQGESMFQFALVFSPAVPAGTQPIHDSQTHATLYKFEF